jgi:Na+/H+ antiporter NhaD/arsenite permease-like protein
MSVEPVVEMASQTMWAWFWVSIAIFAITFILILSERIHRTVIWLIWAVVMVLFWMYMWFYNHEKVVEAIDFNTLWLLFGMMIIIAILEHTWAFQYLWIKVAKKTKWNMWLLVVALWTLTTLLSLILDNVTTIILIVPITIIIAKILKINPTPILMAEALLSDTGWVATLVWDPPNIMIGSAAGFSFNDFLTHSLPVVFFAWIATLITLKIVFRKELKQKPSNIDELMKMNENDAITDMKTLKKIIWVLCLVVVLFFLHSTFHMEPSMVALIWASLALILVSATKDPQKIIEKTELSVLLFFWSLFVIVWGLEHAGVLKELANLITSWADSNIVMTALIILWVAAILSAIVDNIPMTVAMIPIIALLQTELWEQANILWWALAFWVGFGWNGSPIWSTANVIVVAKSEQTDTPITFMGWMKSWLSTMLVTLVIASIAIVGFSQFFMSKTAWQKWEIVKAKLIDEVVAVEDSHE